MLGITEKLCMLLALPDSLVPMNHRSTSLPQSIAQLPSCIGQLVAVLWAIICVIPLVGQEARQPARFHQDVVVRSISLRVTAGQPRFVVAARLLEEGEIYSVPLEPPLEIVDYFERTATQEIDDIDRVCRLDERQKAKLRLAAMGDMSRIARESREVREMHSGIAIREGKSAYDDVAQVNVHLSEGVLREGSMFLRVLKSQLSSEQSEQLAKANFAKLTEPWPVELSVAERNELWQLVLSKNDRAEEPLILWVPNECRALVARLPSAELADFLDDSQIAAIDGWCKP